MMEQSQMNIFLLVSFLMFQWELKKIQKRLVSVQISCTRLFRLDEDNIILFVKKCASLEVMT